MFGITHWSRYSTYGETRWLISTSKNWKPSQSEFLSKHVGPFHKISFSFTCFSHIFAIANHLTGSSINRLANVFIYFLNVNIKCEYKRLFIQIYVCTMLLETSFLLPHLFRTIEFELIQLLSWHQAVVRHFNS